jgi:hypothetical protein
VTAGPVAEHAARLAAAASWLGEEEWRDEVAALAGARPPRTPQAPTFGEVARAGAGLVEGLSRGGRWAEAAGQARRLTRFFAREAPHLGPVAAHAFDGLLAASLARDIQELEDFRALVDEIFP